MTWHIPRDVALTYDENGDRFWALRVGEHDARGLSVHAYLIWQAAHGASSLGEVADRIAAEHGFDAATVLPDVEIFVPYLVGARLLDEVAP